MIAHYCSTLPKRSKSAITTCARCLRKPRSTAWAINNYAARALPNGHRQTFRIINVHTLSQRTGNSFNRLGVWFGLVCAAMTLHGCGSDSGAQVRENIDPGSLDNTRPQYQGPAPKTD